MRDVQLAFTDKNGNAITPTEYIKGEVLSIERPEATAVLTMFPSLECQSLPHPTCNPGINPEKTSAEFNAHVCNIRHHILQRVKAKQGFNTTATVDGPTLVALAKQYIGAINTPGTIPSLEFSWLAVIDRKLTALAEELLSRYEEEMDNAVKDTLPLEEGGLDDTEQPPKTLFGIHQKIYHPKFNILKREFTRLVPMPAGTSTDHKISETNILKDFLVKFEHQVAQYDHNMGDGERSTSRVVGGILFKYTEQNRKRSQEHCELLFDELYVQQKIVKLGWLEKGYWDKAVGPAKDAVYQKKIALIPGPPQNFQSSEIIHNRIKLTWDEPTVNSKAAKRYETEIRKHSGWVQIALSENMSVVVPNLNPNTNYCFRVRAINSIRKGEYSEDLRVTTAVGPPNKPSKPKLQVESSATAVIYAPKLNQEDENGSSVTHIIVERCSHDSDEWQPDEFLISSPGVAIRQEVSLESAIKDIIYYFRIRMKNSGGKSNPSDAVELTVSELIPGPPQNLSASRSSANQIDLKWDEPNLHPKAARTYEIEKKSGETGWSLLAETSSLYETVTGLKPNTEYSFRVCARNENRRGEYSEVLRTRTAAGAPSRPLAPVVNITSSMKATILVQKQDENGSPITHVVIECCAYDGPWCSVEYPIKPNVSVIKQEVTLENDALLFRVRMKSQSGVSSPSEVAKIDLIPGPPQSLSASRSSANQIDLKWDEPSLHPKAARTYDVEKRSGESGWSLLAETSSLYETVTGLKPNTEYSFRVCARNENRRGEYSEVFKTRTAASAPCQPLPPVIHVVSSMKATISVQKLNEEDENGSPTTHVVIERCSHDGPWRSNEYLIKPNISVIKQQVTLENDELLFRVRMKSEAGVSSPSDITEVATIDLIPGPPREIVGAQTHDCSTISWEKPSAHPYAVKNYEVEMHQINTAWKPYAVLEEQHITLNGLTVNTKYWFRVCALNERRKGDYSEELMLETPPGPPSRPSKPETRAINPRQAAVNVQKLKTEEEGGCPVSHMVVDTYSKASTEWSSQEFPIEENTPLIHQEVGLEDSTRFFRVRMKSEAGMSEPSEITEIPISDLPPGPPQNVCATDVSHDHIKLSWNVPSIHSRAAKSYEVELHTDCTGWKQVAIYEGLSAEVTGLKSNSKYWFRVCARNESRIGEFCDEVEANTAAGPPDRPSKPIVQLTPTKALISLQRHIDDENGSPITHIIVERCSQSTTWIEEEFPIAHDSALFRGEIPLDNAMQYFRVKIKNQVGVSEPSEIAEVATIDLNPGPPQNFRVVDNECAHDSIKLTWDIPAIHPAAARGYELELRSKNTEWKHALLAENLYAFATDLSPYTKYWFRICATNENKKGEYSEAIEGTTPPGPPKQPQRPSIEAMPNGKVVISIDRLSDKDQHGSPVESIKVERRSKENRVWISQDFFIYPDDVIIKEDLWLDSATEDTTYYFRVSMINNIGKSQPSDVVEFSTKDLIPGTPMCLQISEKQRQQITLRWDKPDIHPGAAVQYEVQKRVLSGGWTEVGRYPNTYAIVRDLQMDTMYKFQVRALNRKMNAGEYTITEDYTLDLTPGQLQPPRVVGVGQDCIKIRWNKATDNPTAAKRYIVQIKGGQHHDWEQVKSTVHRSAVINNLGSTELYYFRICAENLKGEKGDFSTEVSAWTKRSQGARVAISIVSGIVAIFPGFLTYRATGPEGDLEDSDDDREWLVTSL